MMAKLVLLLLVSTTFTLTSCGNPAPDPVPEDVGKLLEEYLKLN